jgi:hypothetical protein
MVQLLKYPYDLVLSVSTLIVVPFLRFVVVIASISNIQRPDDILVFITELLR